MTLPKAAKDRYAAKFDLLLFGISKPVYYGCKAQCDWMTFFPELQQYAGSLMISWLAIFGCGEPERLCGIFFLMQWAWVRDIRRIKRCNLDRAMAVRKL